MCHRKLYFRGQLQIYVIPYPYQLRCLDLYKFLSATLDTLLFVTLPKHEA